MGTREDFYLGKNENAKWLGSIAWDGYRESIPKDLLNSTTKEDYLSRLNDFFKNRDDLSLPKDGWPWPWDDSSISDCSYWFFNEKVNDELEGRYIPCEININDDYDDNFLNKFEKISFKDMSKFKNVQYGGNKSGIILIT